MYVSTPSLNIVRPRFKRNEEFYRLQPRAPDENIEPRDSEDHHDFRHERVWVAMHGLRGGENIDSYSPKELSGGSTGKMKLREE